MDLGARPRRAASPPQTIYVRCLLVLVRTGALTGPGDPSSVANQAEETATLAAVRGHCRVPVCVAFEIRSQDSKLLVHNIFALTQKLQLQETSQQATMMLSRARPLALRTLTRQQRALSAAPQPVYEPHVVLHQRPDQRRPPTPREEQSDTASAAGYFKTSRHAAAATLE